MVSFEVKALYIRGDLFLNEEKKRDSWTAKLQLLWFFYREIHSTINSNVPCFSLHSIICFSLSSKLQILTSQLLTLNNPIQQRKNVHPSLSVAILFLDWCQTESSTCWIKKKKENNSNSYTRLKFHWETQWIFPTGINP